MYTRCAYFGINKRDFGEWAEKFILAAEQDKIKRLQPKALIPLLTLSGWEGLDNCIVNQFFAFLEQHAPHVVKDIGYLREISDMRFPHEWGVGARNMQRRIIMHVGPTNSGKTFHALQRLKAAKQGIYCSPLRLLAYEIYNRMTKMGISCGLITGEDRRMPDFATAGVKPIGFNIDSRPLTQLVSCTIEMAPNSAYDVAVIDEIQMLSDLHRGWAWTTALMGLRAKEIHLCGEPSAVPLVKRICESMDEEVEVREYTRLGKLKVSGVSLDGDLGNVRKGDCVVVFSRKEIYEIKKAIEEKTGMRCAVIYGGLPPESRAEQARLFNDPDSGYDVLVASDAVGMGINLSINRVVFMTLQKFDGTGTKLISVSQTRQIGGRAGRFDQGTKVGTVATFKDEDLQQLKKSMEQQPPKLAMAGIKPNLGMIEMFSHQFPNTSFAQLWCMFRDISNVDNDYFLCSFDDQEDIARIIEDLPLSISDRYHFLYAPVSIRDTRMEICLRQFAKAVANRRECRVADVIKLPSSVPNNREGIRDLENWHRAITLYLWLSYHFSESFRQSEDAYVLKDKCEAMIQKGLMSIRHLKGRERGEDMDRYEETVQDRNNDAKERMMNNFLAHLQKTAQAQA
ncbi:P-loop containing nucleoside triphosphate hydrolase protein [Coemansia reversa NRRL 1564]|uniref:RNA helicase n=1 Tax=Coemansia reversa (strain ATCC 12441 / NRRL 1564) TaxID=763665 RepID=A0A2G5B4E8_COERN|nr:P-loop containing nucleoside triphosphate hydrolase protein [Coemansia reversa NRRL 1564]|eukprot:PIA13923.1 P-loop containing nucleoside triphosphate hydrolase protein [Coemansia reversa NRRL 1564]